MEIEAGEWIAITGCGVVRSAAPSDERRCAVRVPLGKAIAVYRLSGGTMRGAVTGRLRARIREMSNTGVGLVLTSAPSLSPGEVLVVGLPRRRATPLWVYVAAVRENSQSMGVRAVGARFERVVLPGELRIARPARPQRAAAPVDSAPTDSTIRRQEPSRPAMPANSGRTVTAGPAGAAAGGSASMVDTKATAAQIAWLDQLAQDHMEVYRAIYQRMPAAGIPMNDLIYQHVLRVWENLRAMRETTAGAANPQAA